MLSNKSYFIRQLY